MSALDEQARTLDEGPIDPSPDGAFVYEIAPHVPDGTCFVGGHFPHLEARFPRPRPTPGYRPPKNRLPSDREPAVDLVGQTFGFLFVEAVSFIQKGGNCSWTCRCVAPTGPRRSPCGARRERVKTYDLVHGQAVSCGCAGRSFARIKREQAATG